MPRPLVTLTTDFGADSPYVAQMKGRLLSLHRDAQIVDITHSVPPQNVRYGALALADSAVWFPRDAIHVAVVDPEVGTDRKLVYACIDDRHYLAPDNGLLDAVVRRDGPGWSIWLTELEYYPNEVSATFHGRDILAPVAAQLAAGLDPRLLGPAHELDVRLSWPEARCERRRITGCVWLADSFGNLITNIDHAFLKALAVPPTVRITLGGIEIEGLTRTYGDGRPGSWVALVGSSGRLEIALVNGNAAAKVGFLQTDEGEAEAVVELQW